MTVSVTSVCNRALQHLGAARILDITDDTRNGRSCNACYDPVRRAELRKHYWRFAIARQNLPASTTPPAGTDFKYQFQLPADCVRIIKPQDAFLDWQLEGRMILSNYYSSVPLRYIADITDPNQWDALFAEMVSLQMANQMCEEITQSTSKRATIKDDYKDALKEARRINAFETIPVDGQAESWDLSRI